MIVKKYIADTVEEAQAVIRKDMGPSAVILTLRYVRQQGIKSLFAANKVEVTAAIDEKEISKTPAESMASDMPRPVKETTADVTYRDPRFQPRPEKTTVSERLTPDEEERALRKLEALRRQRPQARPKIPTPAPSAPSEVLRVSENLRQHMSMQGNSHTESVDQLEALRKIVREEMSKATPSTSHSDDSKFLWGKGVDVGIAKTLKDAVASYHDNASRINALKDEIAKRIVTTGPLTLHKGTPSLVAIVGPTGVGKTTALAKIATQYSQELHRNVGVISLDTQKVGAREQIKGLMEPIQCPVITASSTFELTEAVAAFRNHDLVLLDTAGVSQYSLQDLDNLADTLSILKGVTVLLAVSATTKDVDLYSTIERYSCCHVDSLIVTKLDETIQHGILLNLCVKTGAPIRYLSSGQRIPQDLGVADGDQIARSILVKNNAQEYDRFRQLVTVG